jgi:hypothetical protein
LGLIYWEALRTLRRKESVQISRGGRVWQFEEPDTYRQRGNGNRNNRKDSLSSWHGPQKGTGLDLDVISERSGSDHRIIEQMKITPENGDFDLTKSELNLFGQLDRTTK